MEALTRALEAVSLATEDAQKAEAKPDQPTSAHNGCPFGCPQEEAEIATC